MSKYIRDMILITIYFFVLITQLSFSSYLIHNSQNIAEILVNYKNISECRTNAIYRLKDGTLIDTSMAILVSSSVIIGAFILMMINKFILKINNYQSLNYNELVDNSIISQNLISKDKYDIAINIIFIMSIICFIISNGIQFILQLNNISDTCLMYIDMKINNFYIIYKFMICTSFLASYALFFVIPCFI